MIGKVAREGLTHDGFSAFIRRGHGIEQLAALVVGGGVLPKMGQRHLARRVGKFLSHIKQRFQRCGHNVPLICSKTAQITLKNIESCLFHRPVGDFVAFLSLHGPITNQCLVICAVRCDITAVRYAFLMRIAALLGRFLPRLGAVQSFWMALFLRDYSAATL